MFWFSAKRVISGNDTFWKKYGYSSFCKFFSKRIISIILILCRFYKNITIIFFHTLHQVWICFRYTGEIFIYIKLNKTIKQLCYLKFSLSTYKVLYEITLNRYILLYIIHHKLGSLRLVHVNANFNKIVYIMHIILVKLNYRYTDFEI